MSSDLEPKGSLFPELSTAFEEPIEPVGNAGIAAVALKPRLWVPKQGPALKKENGPDIRRERRLARKQTRKRPGKALLLAIAFETATLPPIPEEEDIYRPCAFQYACEEELLLGPQDFPEIMPCKHNVACYTCVRYVFIYFVYVVVWPW